MSPYLLTCLIQGLARPADRSREAERGAGRSRAGRRIGAGGVDLRPPGLRHGLVGQSLSAGGCGVGAG